MKYICTLPIDSDWVDLMKANYEMGGLYTSQSHVRTEGGRSIADAQTCWKEFDSAEQRLVHQEDEHPSLIQSHREQIWQAFSVSQRMDVLEPIVEEFLDPF